MLLKLQKLNKRPEIILGLSLGLCAVGCSGKGYSLPGFSSKETKEAEVREAEVKPPLEQDPTATGDLTHVASNGIRLGESQSDMSMVSFLENSGNGTSQTAQATTKINPVSTTGAEPPGYVRLGGQSEIDRSGMDNYQQVVNSVDQGASGLDALKSSLEELNATSTPSVADNTQNDSGLIDMAAFLAEFESEQSGSTPADDPPASMPVQEETTIQPEQQVAALEQPEAAAPEQATVNSEEFPWAISSTPAGPVVDRVRGLINRATVATQETSRMGTKKITETARNVIEKTQTALIPEHATAEEILADMEARREARTVITPQDKLAESETPVLDEGPLPVIIDLSREWVNGPSRSLKPQDAITQFAQATVVANQGAQLPVITPAQPKNQYLEDISETEPTPELPTTEQVEQIEFPVVEESSVLPLGNLPVDDMERHEMISAEQAVEVEPEAESAPPFIEADPYPAIAMLDSSEGEDLPPSMPLLIAPGEDKTETESEEFDQFAADFADVTVDEAPKELSESPLLIDEAQLHLEPQSTSPITSTQLTIGICSLAMLFMLMLRWKR